MCIGINPSTAEPDRLDPTLQSVERVAKNNGYDSFLMFNVYAQRATRPNDMERVCNEALHRANMEAFDYILSLSEQPAVWAAWGNIIEQRAYLKDCLADMIAIGERHGAQWYTAGLCTARRSLSPCDELYHQHARAEERHGAGRDIRTPPPSSRGAGASRSLRARAPPRKARP